MLYASIKNNIKHHRKSDIFSLFPIYYTTFIAPNIKFFEIFCYNNSLQFIFLYNCINNYNSKLKQLRKAEVFANFGFSITY